MGGPGRCLVGVSGLAPHLAKYKSGSRAWVALTTAQFRQQTQQILKGITSGIFGFPFRISCFFLTAKKKIYLFFFPLSNQPPSPPPDLLLAQPSRNSTYCCGGVRGQPLIRCDTSASHLSSRQSSRGYWQREWRALIIYLKKKTQQNTSCNAFQRHISVDRG